MLTALHKVESGEITSTLYQGKRWQPDTCAVPAVDMQLQKNDLYNLHKQIGVAIGYGFVVGNVTIETFGVRYTKLALSSRGNYYLDAMIPVPCREIVSTNCIPPKNTCVVRPPKSDVEKFMKPSFRKC